jgi:hypothetical protein
MIKTKWKPQKEVERGRIKIDETMDIVVREVVDDDNNTNIDIRIFTRAKNFSGFSSKGVYLPRERISELIMLLERSKNGKD